MTNQAKKVKAHCTLDYFPYKQGKIHACGMPLEQIINISGQTPLYVYDRQLITQRVKLLRSILPKQIKLHYAIKANPMPVVVQQLADLVDGLDIASHGEMLNALSTGINACDISFAGPGKTDLELIAAISSRIVINVESKNELLRINTLSKSLSIKEKIALRINPDFELKTAGMKMSGGAKPFGIDAELITDILKLLASLDVIFVGLHIFSGSQNLKSEAIIEAHNKTFELVNNIITAPSIAENLLADFDFINIGGGFGIPYFPGDQALDIQPIADNLEQLINKYSALKEKQIIIELGRYLVGEAGIYISQIIDKKESRGTNYLVCNGGLHHHLANSGNFGQVIRKNYPVLISKKTSTRELSKTNQVTEKVSIVGPLCTPLDILAEKVELPIAEVGDYVVILQSGAYGKSASPENFLGHPPAKEILL
jgi:diaminopimelate decarboxylase